MKKTAGEWFESWFDTDWYHMLYCNRDEDEARLFIENLMNYLRPKPNAKLLDLACGKGRHAHILSSLGFEVWGIDLSKKSIREAQQKAHAKLHFEVHDMRKTYKPGYFDIILNLFTSFGYFNNKQDNFKVMKSVWEGLKPQGIFVLDFLNAHKVCKELIASETITKNGIEFRIERKFENNVIIKLIEFEANGKTMLFEERVTAFTRDDLRALFEPCQLKIKEEFGDYQLHHFNENTSDRLIIVAEKAN